MHEVFHNIVVANSGNIPYSVNGKLLSRSTEKPVAEGRIKLNGLDPENEFVPKLSFMDEENKEATVR